MLCAYDVTSLSSCRNKLKSLETPFIPLPIVVLYYAFLLNAYLIGWHHLLPCQAWPKATHLFAVTFYGVTADPRVALIFTTKKIQLQKKSHLPKSLSNRWYCSTPNHSGFPEWALIGLQYVILLCPPLKFKQIILKLIFCIPRAVYTNTLGIVICVFETFFKSQSIAGTPTHSPKPNPSFGGKRPFQPLFTFCIRY